MPLTRPASCLRHDVPDRADVGGGDPLVAEQRQAHDSTASESLPTNGIVMLSAPRLNAQAKASLRP